MWKYYIHDTEPWMMVSSSSAPEVLLARVILREYEIICVKHTESYLYGISYKCVKSSITMQHHLRNIHRLVLEVICSNDTYMNYVHWYNMSDQLLTANACRVPFWTFHWISSNLHMNNLMNVHNSRLQTVPN